MDIQASTTLENLFQEINPSQQEWISKIDALINSQELSESNFISLVQSPLPQYEEHSKDLEQTEQVSSQFKKTTSVNSYQKNICSYISKKIVLYFIDTRNIRLVRRFCKLANCSLADSLKYYKQRSKQIFGIHHLTRMITPESSEEINMKKMFCAFLNWFLRNKYLYYLLKFGKMEDKEKYIEFKNNYLLYIAEVEETFSHYF